MADFDKLDDVINELEEQAKDLKMFSEVYSEISKLKEDIATSLELLKTNSNEFDTISNNIRDRFKEAKLQFENFEIDNKNFKKELNSDIASRLDKHKSDIEVTIRNEGSQIQRGFENALIAQFNGMAIKLDTMTNKIEDHINIQNVKTQNIIKRAIFIVIGGIITIIGSLIGLGFYLGS